MKNLILILMLMVVAVPVFADDVSLSWDPSSSDGVTGYIVYYGTDPGNLEHSVNAGDVLTYVVKDLPPGDWNFIVKAYNDANVSDPSNMVDKVLEAYVPVENPHEPAVPPEPPAVTGAVVVNVSVNVSAE